MGKKNYKCEELSIDHDQLVKLRNAGALNLGIVDSVAMKISSTSGFGPKTTSSAAFHFWNWIGIGAFAYTVYLSFTDHWWWFIVGIVAVVVIGRANQKGNSENVLDGAYVDAEFYERVRAARGWIYQLEEAEAEAYRVS
jgi:hypothetical protein